MVYAVDKRWFINYDEGKDDVIVYKIIAKEFLSIDCLENGKAINREMIF